MLGFGQTDSIRKTDNMSARLNFEILLNYSMWNTNLSFETNTTSYQYDNSIRNGALGFRNYGISCDFKLGKQLWLQTGISSSVSANTWTNDTISWHGSELVRFGVPLKLIKDFNNRDDAPYFSLGVVPMVFTKYPHGNKIVTENTANTYRYDGWTQQYVIEENFPGRYEYRDYGMDLSLGIGKIFYMDGRTYFRMELAYTRSMVSLLKNPNKMQTDILEFKVGFSSLFDKKK